MDFSSANRTQFIHSLKSEEFELIVIGGGITGAGIALDAASRGLKTALVEKSDFASGTSSRSTKLIHGGLRYLKQFEFALVKEVGSERAVVHRLAPHLVIPEKMLLPLREKRGFGSLLTRFGLKLYDWLAGVTGKDRRLMLTRNQTLRREPLLKKNDVKGGALYAEYRTDDARLTIEVIKKAVEYGATIVNYCEVKNIIYENKKVIGVMVTDTIKNHQFEIKGKVVVNATGPWVDELRSLDKSKKGKMLHLTKGVHLVLPRSKMPIKQSIYFDIEDGRMIFAIPRGQTTYIGTTDTNYNGKIEEVCTEREDVEYLLRGVNENFPTINLTIEDVESSWAGLRPLIHEEGKTASELSRKDEIFISPSGLISIAGGKLTGYRKMAERVLDTILEEYFDEKKLKPCTTNRIKLSDAKFGNYRGVRIYLSKVRKKLIAKGLDEAYSGYLVGLYGHRADIVLNHMNYIVESDIDLKILKSELWFAVNYEMACSSIDFFNRRTGRIYFDIASVMKYQEQISFALGRHLNWTEDQLAKDRIALGLEIEKAIAFKKN